MEDVGVDPGFWRGRRVLVTGHTGFKGSWLALWLQELGAEVAGFGLDPPSSPSLFEAARIGEGMTDLRGDVRDRGAVADAVAETRPDLVLHLAAQPLVRASFEDPVGTYETNVMGTANVLAAGAPAVVVVSSDKCYAPRADGAPCREGDPLGGADPYSSSKACAELVAASWRESFGTAIATVRAGNVIGGGDWAADRLVPDAMRAALDGRPLLVRNPDAVRPWQHVLNPLSGYLEVAQRLREDPAAADAWNFGPVAGDELPVRAIADRLAALWGEGLEWRAEGDGGPPETAVLRLDSARARERLGWEPRWDLDEALSATVDWFRAWRGGADARAITAAQVAAYTTG
ncbi:MAG: CDP-glucose 4,6-dehydratase [Actinomycetota bacterium]|nr:CDP-glucose 4,6-dehydratase [Actinomycetota bacterium]